MDKAKDELKTILLNALAGPELDAVLIAEHLDTFLASEGVTLSRELLWPQAGAADDRPNVEALTLTHMRQETAAGVAGGDAPRARRLRAMLWDPKVEPPFEGVTVYQIFDQRIWWMSKTGPIKIEDMVPSHRKNLLAFLEKRADAYKFQDDWNTVASFPDDPSDGVAAAISGMQSDMGAETSMQWLNKKKLVKTLRKFVKADAKEAAEWAKKQLNP